MQSCVSHPAAYSPSLDSVYPSPIPIALLSIEAGEEKREGGARKLLVTSMRLGA